MAWKPGDRLTHRFNPDLGPGLVETVEDRTVVVHFPEADAVLRLAADSDAIAPLRFVAGATRSRRPPRGGAARHDAGISVVKYFET